MADAFVGLGSDFLCSPISVETEGDLAISAAVGIGGKNVSADVKTIQAALNRVPPAEGGPSPPLAVDGIAGKLTIKAISRFQNRHVGFSDGRVDTNNVTIAALRKFSGGNGQDIPTFPSAPAAGAKKKSVLRAPKNPKPPDQADLAAMRDVSKLLKEAQRWIFIADAVAGLAQDHLQGRASTLFKRPAERSFASCDKFFKLKGISKSSALAALTFVRGILFKMKTCIGVQVRLDVDPNSPLGFFQVDPTENNSVPPAEALMFTSFGGFSSRDKNGKPGVTNGLRDDSIFVTTKRMIADELLFGSKIVADDTTYIMIHELAHFVGPGINSRNRIDDHAARHVDKLKFDNLPHFLAVRNADTYGRFCVDVTPNVKLSQKLNQN